ncbi:kinesin-like protein KIF1C, partial [Leucoraja erinacea]|uniref:kinesin-like protein KIF1C n=1 Tax=Leucoraja erinaceus TaxID=7782 RepID=UPI00245555B3
QRVAMGKSHVFRFNHPEQARQELERSGTPTDVPLMHGSRTPTDVPLTPGSRTPTDVPLIHRVPDPHRRAPDPPIPDPPGVGSPAHPALGERPPTDGSGTLGERPPAEGGRTPGEGSPDPESRAQGGLLPDSIDRPELQRRLQNDDSRYRGDKEGPFWPLADVDGSEDGTGRCSLGIVPPVARGAGVAGGRRRRERPVYQIPQRRRWRGLPLPGEDVDVDGDGGGDVRAVTLAELRAQAVRELCYEVALGGFGRSRRDVDALTAGKMRELGRAYRHRDPDARASRRAVAAEVWAAVGGEERPREEVQGLRAHVERLSGLLHEVKLQNNMKEEQIRTLHCRLLAMESAVPTGTTQEYGPEDGHKRPEPEPDSGKPRPGIGRLMEDDPAFRRGRLRWLQLGDPSRRPRHRPGSGRFIPPLHRELRFPFKSNPQHRGSWASEPVDRDLSGPRPTDRDPSSPRPTDHPLTVTPPAPDPPTVTPPAPDPTDRDPSGPGPTDRDPRHDRDPSGPGPTDRDPRHLSRRRYSFDNGAGSRARFLRPFGPSEQQQQQPLDPTCCPPAQLPDRPWSHSPPPHMRRQCSVPDLAGRPADG